MSSSAPSPSATKTSDFDDRVAAISEKLILWTRYILVPFYVCLILAITTIGYDFVTVLIGHAEEGEYTLKILSLLDIMMIANFIWLIAAGSFYVFVDSRGLESTKQERPHGLTHVSAGLLKEKMAGSLIGVASVHLLNVFLKLQHDAHPVDWNKMGARLAIYGAFIVGFLAFSHVNASSHHNHSKSKHGGNHE